VLLYSTEHFYNPYMEVCLTLKRAMIAVSKHMDYELVFLGSIACRGVCLLSFNIVSKDDFCDPPSFLANKHRVWFYEIKTAEV
jgi:hypothetical protein